MVTRFREQQRSACLEQLTGSFENEKGSTSHSARYTWLTVYRALQVATFKWKWFVEPFTALRVIRFPGKSHFITVFKNVTRRACASSKSNTATRENGIRKISEEFVVFAPKKWNISGSVNSFRMGPILYNRSGQELSRNISCGCLCVLQKVVLEESFFHDTKKLTFSWNLEVSRKRLGVDQKAFGACFKHW